MGGRRHLCAFALTSGEVVTIRCTPVLDGPRIVGALARVEPTGRPVKQPGRRTNARSFGWDSLTAAELAVAAQVSRGLTNREAAAHLYLSPHTVDFHLRQLFRKLGVQSRVELTRAVLERGDLAWPAEDGPS
jgi:DNA-binding CsgD family transcriptional regulator